MTNGMKERRFENEWEDSCWKHKKLFNYVKKMISEKYKNVGGGGVLVKEDMKKIKLKTVTGYLQVCGERAEVGRHRR